MQSYGIIGVTLWIICGVYGETTVSLRRNCSVPPQKLSFPAVETVISNSGNDSSPPGNGKLMYTINFCPPGELAYVRFILCGRYFDLQPICNSICNAPTIYQLVYYTLFVAGGRCFHVFSTLQQFPKVSNKNNYDTIPLVRCHNLNRTMPRNRSHNDMMKLH